jgi:hypothetical protein
MRAVNGVGARAVNEAGAAEDKKIQDVTNRKT